MRELISDSAFRTLLFIAGVFVFVGPLAEAATRNGLDEGFMRLIGVWAVLLPLLYLLSRFDGGGDAED